ncbi:MAG: phosphatase PAP2 family protein [Acidobacteriia bacterium]|nr:phosphatase PAP2 family protein [Terriglobia bacterium]
MLGCCWLTAVEALSAPCCYAQPQEQQASALPSAKEHDVQQKPAPEPDSSSLPAKPTASPAHYDKSLGPTGGPRLGLMGRFLGDQKEIWTSPARLRFSDTDWLVPLSGITAGLFVTDRDFSKHLSQSPTTISHYKMLSDAGAAALVGGAGGMWLLGHASHNEHWSETGFLAGEAAVNSLVAVEGLKYSLRRERPYQGDGSGSFFQSGGTSFPSEHAAAAWSVAGVIAHEYPGPLTQIVAYGLASLITVSRVKAQQHFSSDVLVGSIIGNLVAQNIYSRHHDPELGGGEWRSISQLFRGDGTHSPGNQGSPYVPLDSWIYPALERLGALGYLDSEFLGMRPWTRAECAHLVDEVGDRIRDGQLDSPEVSHFYDELSKEFDADLKALSAGREYSMRVESIYARTTEITGPPLNDSYHFGQTIINNYGRPYQRGFNTVDGFSGWGTKGRFTIYVRGEYQHAPSAPGYSNSVQNVIAAVDQTPAQPATPVLAANQFRLLDTYVAANVAGWEMAFGKQSLWWGPGEGGALIFSDNAEPIYMARASRISPTTLPWIFHLLGPMKVDLFFGKLSGNEFPPRPLLHGEKISFKPTKNLELGFSRTSEFGGVGRPLTAAAIFNSYVSFVSSGNYGANDNPGKRTGGFDFSYRVPFVRKWLTLYSDSITADDPSPLAAPPRAAISGGLYMPRLPGLPKLDLRVEAVNTDTPSSRSTGGKFVYWELFYYHNLYLNKNNLIGSWIGREGVGYQAWSTYSFSPKNTLRFGFRHAKVDSDFIPGGETVNDGSVKLDWWMRHDLSLSTSVQYEKWFAPLLAPTPQTNWTSSVEIAFRPRSWTK